MFDELEGKVRALTLIALMLRNVQNVSANSNWFETMLEALGMGYFF